MDSVSYERDWASLPSPLLRLVAERLIAVSYARLRAVCTAWASAVSPEEWEEGQNQSYYLPRSLHCPWLMIANMPGDRLNFLSLTESLRPYRIHGPSFFSDKRIRIIGSHAGWLAVVDLECNLECNLSLINPLTHRHIPLPSVTTITIPTDFVPRDIGRHPTSPTQFLSTFFITMHDFCHIYFRKIILSSSPSSQPDDFIVVFMFDRKQWLAFARAGDTAWTVLDKVPPKKYGYADAVFLDRKLYAVADHGQIDAFDFSQTTPRPTVVADRNSWRTPPAVPRCLVFSAGDLLVITRIVQDDVDKTPGFIVEKIDLTGEGKKRVPVNDLGRRSIFIGMNQSLSISTEEIPAVRHNCIYFNDDYLDSFFSHGDKRVILDMAVFNIKEGSCEMLYPLETWLSLPPPIWFTPVIN